MRISYGFNILNRNKSMIFIVITLTHLIIQKVSLYIKSDIIFLCVMHNDIVSLTVALIIQARQVIRILRTSGNEVSRRYVESITKSL